MSEFIGLIGQEPKGLVGGLPALQTTQKISLSPSLSQSHRKTCSLFSEMSEGNVRGLPNYAGDTQLAK